ncbi:hypothetical protein ESZ50_01395 [Weissella muntiaci]|uniref:Uncharacterized protein n=1 Tax=Weissella muntiaci TaxID=2508881 RepID=A0A6C2CBP7_9LACO|nr:hypothetical protein [Weissella muntiaci]TYC50899.1 hypothetical protein ESZ50_01395 [Weissella muntiaci]
MTETIKDVRFDGTRFFVEDENGNRKQVFPQTILEQIIGLDSLRSVRGYPGPPGKVGKSAFETAKESGFPGTEDEFDQLLANIQINESTKRKAPTSWSLDRTTTPWTIRLDNGSTLQLNDYGQVASVFGLGSSPNLESATVTPVPIISNIIKAARGTLSIDLFKKTSGSNFNYYSPNYTINNPVQDVSIYDFTVATFGVTGDTYNRQWVLIKMLYELGIFSPADVESLGATKK